MDRPPGGRRALLRPDKILLKADFAALLDAVDGRPGDFILFCADRFSTVCRTLGGLRLDLADLLGLRRNPGDYKFCFVTDFPQFEYSKEEGRYVATHHPFTMPYPEDLPYLLTDPARVRAQAYDVVLNGVELGSGSIRIHSRDVQKRMFEALLLRRADRERFGFLVNAFSRHPPHGGFAFGLDRLVMQMSVPPCARRSPSPRRRMPLPTHRRAGPRRPAQPDALGLAGPPGGRGRPRQGAAQPARVDVDAAAKLARLRVAPEERSALERRWPSSSPLPASSRSGHRGSAAGHVVPGKRLPAGQGRNAPAARGPARGRETWDGCFFVRRSWNEEE
ncbi:MAG: amino acid--tRNA ligase-related protein [Anaerotruncus massiliensis (ex Togo et al. 2019)]